MVGLCEVDTNTILEDTEIVREGRTTQPLDGPGSSSKSRFGDLLYRTGLSGKRFTYRNLNETLVWKLGLHGDLNQMKTVSFWSTKSLLSKFLRICSLSTRKNVWLVKNVLS